MKGCVICNGAIRDYEWAKGQVAECELIIAADGGAVHLNAMNVVPHVMVGDMDSMPDPSWPQDEQVERISFPEDKDKSDAELAVELAFERGCTVVTLLGAAGGRLDHLLGNVSLLAKYPGRLAMVTSDATLVAVDPSEKCRLQGGPLSRVSLIPFPVAEQVTTTGLHYSLMKQDLLPGTRGISNALSQQEGCVCVSGGLLLVYAESKGAVDDGRQGSIPSV